MVKINKKIIFLITTLVVLLDQLTKFVVKSNLKLNESIEVIKGIFHITYSHNYGASFGLLEGYTWLFILFSFIVIGAAAYYWKRIPNKKSVIWMTALVLAGAIGNLIDRLAYGYVIDFFDFRIWPIFNIADLALMIGCVGLIIYFWKK